MLCSVVCAAWCAVGDTGRARCADPPCPAHLALPAACPLRRSAARAQQPVRPAEDQPAPGAHGIPVSQPAWRQRLRSAAGLALPPGGRSRWGPTSLAATAAWLHFLPHFPPHTLFHHARRDYPFDTSFPGSKDARQFPNHAEVRRSAAHSTARHSTVRHRSRYRTTQDSIILGIEHPSAA